MNNNSISWVLKENSREGWIQLYEKYLEFIEEDYEENRESSNELTEFRINYIVDSKFSESNLRYFFPFEINIHVKYPNAKISLNLYEKKRSDKLNIDESDIERLKAYLQFQNVKNTQIIFYRYDGENDEWCGIPIKSEKVINHSVILPITHVTLDESSKFHYIHLSNSYYMSNEKKNVVSQHNTVLYIKQLCEFCNDYIDTILKNKRYVGTVKNAMRLENKNQLINELSDILGDYLSNISIIAQVIWLYYLEELLESKELFQLEGDDGHYMLRRDFLDKSYFDSIAYAEGIFQLIENACMHSEMHCGWFGFRIHRAGKNRPISELLEETSMRDELRNRYIKCCEKAHNIFNEDYRFFLEMYVIDSCIKQKGILASVNENIRTENAEILEKEIKRCELRESDDLFTLPPRGYVDGKIMNCDAYIEDMTIHYGLRWFNTIVKNNQGYFSLYSPGQPDYHGYRDGHVLESNKQNRYFTEYSILLPLSYQWEQGRKEKMEDNDVSTIYTNEEMKNLHYVKLLEQSGTSKIEIVKKYNAMLEIELSNFATIADKNQTLYVIEGKKIPIVQVECLAKSIFYVLAKIHFNQCGARPKIAIILKSKADLYEFTRIFTIFYYRNGECNVVQSAQIALCLMNENNELYVSYLFAGENISSARKTAETFLYNNGGATADMLSLVKYLTYVSKNKETKAIKYLDFDVLLNYMSVEEEGWSEPITIDRKKDTIFVKNMNRLINSDYQRRPIGCKLNGVGVKLGRKLWLKDFYMAEMLFNNSAHTHRFAHIMMEDIIQRMPTEDKKVDTTVSLLVVGYENYSHLLVRNVVERLNSIDKYEAVSCVIINSNYENSCMIFDNDCRRAEILNMKKINVVSIVPIGSTMSTFYKLHNSVRKEFDTSVEFNFLSNNCVLAVNALIEDDEKKNWKQNIEGKYWGSREISRTIELTKECASGHTLEVDYILNANSKWYTLEEASNNDLKNIPIIGVNKSSTMPDAIFSLKDQKIKYVMDPKNVNTNTRRLKQLFGNITYSHIKRGDNHHQMYIHCDSIFTANRTEIIEWLEKEKKGMDTVGFNIIIAPIHETNSNYLNYVIEHVFSGNVRVLYLPIEESYKEDIRTKFSFIAEEYRVLKQTNAKINIYYIDDSIVTGRTIKRANMYINMLLMESGMSFALKMFKGIFLLVNRSSYETIASFLAEPVKELHSYIYLDIPCFNTHGGVCPSCDMVEKYKVLCKRATTIELALEFKRLGMKHQVRTLDEYSTWEDENIRNSSAYFYWVANWVYFQDINNSNDNELCFNLVKKHRKLVKNTNNKIYKIINTFLKSNYKENSMSCYKISDMENCGEVVEYVKEHLLSTRAYMRLIAMNEAYCALIPLPSSYHEMSEDKADNNQQLYKQTRKIIIQLMQSKLVTNDNEVNIQSNVEWIISYIKVVSRNHIANYYHCKYAIYNILLDIYDCLLLEDTEQYWKIHQDSDIKKIIDSLQIYNMDGNINITLDSKYQVFMVVLQRLADMNSRYVFTRENMKGYINLYKKLQEKSALYLKRTDVKSYRKYVFATIPDANTAILRILKSIKVASTFEQNDMCRLPMEYSEETYQNIEGFDFTEYRNRIYLENSLYIYKGLYDLSQRCVRGSDSIDLLDEVILQERNTTKILYQNPLSDFCRSWNEMHEREQHIVGKRTQGDGDDKTKIPQLLDYYLLLVGC